jgi:methylthioribose-1-phosphate isomerase
MNVNDKPYRTIWVTADAEAVEIIDQRQLPHQFVTERISSPTEMALAIRDMHIRGAGAIGAAAGFGMYLALVSTNGNLEGDGVQHAAVELKASRPTAVNLGWAVDRQLRAIAKADTPSDRIGSALREAQAIADEDAEACRRIGEHGLAIIESIAAGKPNEPVNILTHCNAGWLAFVDYGSATAPIYAAHDAGISVHVWVDETRPRNQGARLTAWELGQHGVPHTVIVDNTGGHLMQHGMIDMVIVGSDRTSVTGFVTNKIGTYLKALAAKDNGVPFYVALPSSTFDWTMRDGIAETPIEQRHGDEVKYAEGLIDGDIRSVLLMPVDSQSANYAFDVTPPRLVTALITERGVIRPNESDILAAYPERR